MHRGLACARVAQKETVQRDEVRRLAVQLPVIVDQRELDKEVGLLLDRVETDLHVELGQGGP